MKIKKKNKKISIITVVKNGIPFIEQAIISYKNQTYSNKELIVVYSKSEDQTLKVLKKYKKKKIINKLILDKQSKNKYRSLNLGIKASSGNIIGILHADDLYHNNNVLKEVANNFQNECDILFGDIYFVQRKNIKIKTRIWKESNFNPYKLYFGWMPPHTSTYIKSSILKKYNYSTNFTIAADYNHMILLFKKNYKFMHLKKYLCKMRDGGTSRDFKHLNIRLAEEIKITFKYFGILFIFVLILKRLRKLNQFLIIK